MHTLGAIAWLTKLAATLASKRRWSRSALYPGARGLSRERRQRRMLRLWWYFMQRKIPWFSISELFHLNSVHCARDGADGLEGGSALGYVGGLIKAGVFGLHVAEHVAGRTVKEPLQKATDLYGLYWGGVVHQGWGMSETADAGDCGV